MKNFLFSEKRRQERLSLPIVVFYALSNTAGSDQRKWTKPVAVIDMSGHGFKILSCQALVAGVPLDLKIDFCDGSTPIIFAGEVVWCKEDSEQRPHEGKNRAGVDKKIYAVGVKFYKMPHEDRKRFVSYMCENIIGACLDDEGNLRS